MRQHQFKHLLTLILCFFSTYNSSILAQNAISPEKADEIVNYKFQTAKKQFYLGGSFGLGFGIQSYSAKVNDYAFLGDLVGNAKGGFFPINRLLVGGTVDYTAAYEVASGEEPYAVRTFTYGPFVRYYISKSLFAEGQYTWGKGQEKNIETVPANQRFDAQRYAIGVGMSHFWGKRISFELLMRYSAAKGNILNPEVQTLNLSNIGITAGVGVALGKAK